MALRSVVRGIGRFFIFAFLAGYAYGGLASWVEIGTVALYRHQDMAVLGAKIAEAGREGDSAAVAKWVRVRPPSDTPALAAVLERDGAKLNADVFFEMARRASRANDAEEALFWFQFGKYRLRYDVLRCGADGSARSLNALMIGLAPRIAREAVDNNPAALQRSVRRVLALDAQAPAANTPDWVCRAVKAVEKNDIAPLPTEDWPQVRRNLRASAEMFLKSAAENPPGQ